MVVWVAAFVVRPARWLFDDETRAAAAVAAFWTVGVLALVVIAWAGFDARNVAHLVYLALVDGYLPEFQPEVTR